MELERTQVESRHHHFLMASSHQPIVQCYIEGVETIKGRHEIINSVPKFGWNNFLYKWKINIAKKVRFEAKGKQLKGLAAISLSFYFNPMFRKRPFDSDNFTKPVIDAVAFGLSDRPMPSFTGPKVRFGVNDSSFRWCYFERHDIKDGNEGVQITVSSDC